MTGIIMASGLSRRYGKNKLTEEFQGVPLLQRVISNVLQADLDRVILVYHDDKVKEIAKAFPVELIYNSNPEVGQSESIKRGVEATHEKSDLMFFVGDQPDLDQKLIRCLVEEFRRDPSGILVPCYQGVKGNPVIFSKDFRNALLAIQGDKGGSVVMKEYPQSVKTWEVPSSFQGGDIDKPEDKALWELRNMELVIVRGGGDIASGVIYRLVKSGFSVIVLETDKPTMIRRKVSFSTAVYEGTSEVEGIVAKLCNTYEEIWETIQKGEVPVIVDPKGDIIKVLSPLAVVDAILAKKNLGMNRDMAPITVALGPGFTAGVDVDMVIETQRGHFLGRVLHTGKPAANTGIPGNISGYRSERVLRAPTEGIVKVLKDIGSHVTEGETVGLVEGVPFKTQISGVVRGMITPGAYVTQGMKIGDVDPRDNESYCTTISDKAMAVAGGVLEAILYGKNQEGRG